MTRKEEIIEAGIEYTMSRCPVCIGGGAFAEQMKEFNRNRAFEAGAEWMQKTMVEKAYEYAEARYDLDYCGNIRDVLNYLKSLVEE